MHEATVAGVEKSALQLAFSSAFVVGGDGWRVDSYFPSVDSVEKNSSGAYIGLMEGL